ncbi:acyl-CoA carboxylase subunit epsilon [Arthrobacter sp. RAF14]|uniref:acyl-CoA carboxylase subunit epsilon n=1 Tax=Arthrobacter sp. RAF14 TaxID=3233051 RepID=UPI003F9282D1
MATDTADAAQGGVESEQPFLSVIRGDPTPEELAALTAVVSALAAAPQQDSAAPTRHSERFWHRRAQFNVPLKAGPGSWRRSRG